MNDVVRVTVLERPHNLLKESSRFIFWHLASSDNVFKQFSGKVFDYHDYIRRCVDYVVSVRHSL